MGQGHPGRTMHANNWAENQPEKWSTKTRDDFLDVRRYTNITMSAKFFDAAYTETGIRKYKNLEYRELTYRTKLSG